MPIAEMFDQTRAELLEIKGDNPFRNPVYPLAPFYGSYVHYGNWRLLSSGGMDRSALASRARLLLLSAEYSPSQPASPLGV
jgi:hypothetical protein